MNILPPHAGVQDALAKVRPSRGPNEQTPSRTDQGNRVNNSTRDYLETEKPGHVRLAGASGKEDFNNDISAQPAQEHPSIHPLRSNPSPRGPLIDKVDAAGVHAALSETSPPGNSDGQKVPKPIRHGDPQSHRPESSETESQSTSSETQPQSPKSALLSPNTENNHTTSITSHHRPAVTHATMHPKTHTIYEPHRTRSFHVHEHRTVIQPIIDPEPKILPEKHYIRDEKTGKIWRIGTEEGKMLEQKLGSKSKRVEERVTDSIGDEHTAADDSRQVESGETLSTSKAHDAENDVLNGMSHLAIQENGPA
ncbi:hypothetical protein UCRPC4_g00168 [Phaeomoniella chlamydospora]|uniref:Uncharacterized protein n=1 Tax=Phaeomoniella chlamydospora TaxID=158046 RepID=A0A0G2F4F2_PHACM|nr:hypothetical protein UCRPC4_g00168 [Phaeomoniella chlamydospora]